MENSGIIRNSLKIKAIVKNARSFLEVQKKEGDFAHYIWQFTDGKTINNSWKTIKSVPASTKESNLMAKELKKRGFTFICTTIFMDLCKLLVWSMII